MSSSAVSSSAAGVSAGEAFGVLLRRAVPPTAVVVALCSAVALVWKGGAAGLSALVGGVMVIAFFGLRLVVMQRVATAKPQLVMMTAMVVYSVKVLALGLALILLTRVSWVNGPALGLTLIVGAVVWLAFELRGFVQMRIPVFMTDEDRT